MKKILFVDDEPRVLQGLQRMLHGLRQEWNMHFVDGGQKALELMEQQPFDVVISDMRMPGMNGAELLKQVMDRYPQTIRIILSGHSDREMILRSVRTAHQFLSKPCDADTLKFTVVRAFRLRELISNDELKQLVSKMETLPSLPNLYVEITNELQSPDVSIQKVSSIIEKDIGMSAKILQLVNSAFFGLPRHVSSPAQAVSLLGLEIVKSLVLSVHVFSQFDQTGLRNLSLNALWQHSTTVGQFSKKIYEYQSNDKNFVSYALIAGLLHDLGKLILMVNFPEKYETILSTAMREKLLLHEMEQNTFNVTHSEIGAYLLGLWGLPDLVVEAVANHHHPGKVPAKFFGPLTTLHVANTIEHELYPDKVLGAAQFIDEDYLLAVGVGDQLPIWRDICQVENEKESNR